MEGSLHSTPELRVGTTKLSPRGGCYADPRGQAARWSEAAWLLSLVAQMLAKRVAAEVHSSGLLGPETS